MSFTFLMSSDVMFLRYFEAHLALKVEQVKRSEGGAFVPQQMFFKVTFR